MFKLINKRRGQSTLEYAVLVVIIIGALLTIQTYIKRGVQGRLKSATDDIGDQYSPGNTNSVKVTTVSSNTREEFGMNGQQGVSKSSLLTPESTNTSENTTIMNVEQEYWGK